MDAMAKRLYTGTVKLVKRYEELIVKDPELARRLESGIRLASYLVPGRMGGSWAVTETAYSLANLYCLLNDYIVTRKCPSASPLSKVAVYSYMHMCCVFQLAISIQPSILLGTVTTAYIDVVPGCIRMYRSDARND